MSIFRNYDGRKAGGVNANAFPRVHPIPWVPSQQNVRTNPNIPTQPQRIQPHERGTWHPSSASGGGTLAPSMSSSSGCGCGGGGGVTGADAPTASEAATGHSFAGNAGKVAPRPLVTAPRLQPRTVGALRPTLRSGSSRVSLAPFISGRNAGR